MRVVSSFHHCGHSLGTKISWWLDEPRVAQFIGAFDRSILIFTVRSNDLIFQTAAIKLFIDPATGLRTNWTTPDLRVRSCHVQEHIDGPFRPTYYVAPPHDATQAHRQRPPNFIAPFCGPGRRTALE